MDWRKVDVEGWNWVGCVKLTWWLRFAPARAWERFGAVWRALAGFGASSGGRKNREGAQDAKGDAKKTRSGFVLRGGRMERVLSTSFITASMAAADAVHSPNHLSRFLSVFATRNGSHLNHNTGSSRRAGARRGPSPHKCRARWSPEKVRRSSWTSHRPREDGKRAVVSAFKLKPLSKKANGPHA